MSRSRRRRRQVRSPYRQPVWLIVGGGVILVVTVALVAVALVTR